MYDLTDFESYKEYFALLAEQHNAIAGFVFGDQEVQNNEVRSWKGTQLWLWPYGPVRVEDSRSDNYLKRKEGVLFVGGAAASGKYLDEDNQFKTCEAIIESIISRMLKDSYEQKLVTRINGYSYERSEIRAATKMIGCELRFTFYDPSGFEFNETQWTIPED